MTEKHTRREFVREVGISAAALPFLGLRSLGFAQDSRRKQRLIVKVAGGASLGGEDRGQFEIGKRNMVMLRKLLWKNGVFLDAEDVGGREYRTLSLEIATGRVTISSKGREWQL